MNTNSYNGITKEQTKCKSLLLQTFIAQEPLNKMINMKPKIEYYTQRLKDPTNTELENILLEIKINKLKEAKK